MTFYVEGLSKYRDADSQVRRLGEYATLEEAVIFAQRAIDEFLRGELKPGMTARELYAQYEGFGEVPCIFRDDGKTMSIPGFNHWQHAMATCTRLCAGE